MATELSLSSKGTEEFEDLFRPLKWGNDFAIHFAVVNPPLTRKQMAEELRIRLEKEQIKVYPSELDGSNFDLLSISHDKVPPYCFRGEESKKAEFRAVLFFFGIEKVIAADADTRRLFFDRLNWQRDKLRETLVCPIVIWLPEFALRILALEAPDFWAWRSGVYYLEPEPLLVLKETDELFKIGTTEYDDLTYHEKVMRLQQFKALLEEYENRTFEEKTEVELLGIQLILYQELGELSLSLSNYEDAKQYFLRGLEIAERLEDKELLLSCFSNLLSVSLIQEGRATAAEYGKKLLKLAQDLGNKTKVAATFALLGLIFNLRKEDYDKAGECFKESLKIAEELENKGLQAVILDSIGTLAKAQEKYTEARSFLEQSLKINEEIDNKTGIVDSLCALSDLAQRQGNIEEAFQKIDQALILSKEVKDQNTIAKVSKKLASLTAVQGDYQRAREYYEESFKIAEKLGNKLLICEIHRHLGDIAKASGNYEEAEGHYNESLKIAKEKGITHLIPSIQSSLGTLYLRTEDFIKAERRFLDALEMSESLGNSEMVEIAREGLRLVREMQA